MFEKGLFWIINTKEFFIEETKNPQSKTDILKGFEYIYVHGGLNVVVNVTEVHSM